jgi:hypothetical protein
MEMRVKGAKKYLKAREGKRKQPENNNNKKKGKRQSDLSYMS